MKLKGGLKNCGKSMMNYNELFLETHKKANQLINFNPGPVKLVIQNSISTTYSIPEYESTMELIKHIKYGNKVTILASWLSLMKLEIFSRSGKIEEVTLLDHDPSVISLGKNITTMYPNMNVKYIRKNVVFDDITGYIKNSQVIIVPSINQLLPFDELLPNLPKDTLVSVSGTSNMKMRYGNPIYNADDLKSQITCSDVFFAKQYNSTWGVNNQGTFKFITSVVVARI
jgi:hypothetical protein